ncbi:hypothetical protein [Bradyrhizobium cosmicum]|uniref:hypothetical protein n=1 Tax=Bradyrhizobium cosmicum TaxID=1404864 RepID=UPI0028E44ED1|nr:hypothetical protein [Bradyrhizobium cosmicum]
MSRALRRAHLTKGKSNAKCSSWFMRADGSPGWERDGAGSDILQGMRRTAKSVREELRRASLQDRVPDVSQSLQEVRAMVPRSLRATCFIATLAAGAGGLVSFHAGFAAAKGMQTLTGEQIRARFAGKQLTDEVHYRFVYDPDGTLRSYSMGAKKIGKWRVEEDELCLDLGERDDGCYRVTLSGQRIELMPTGLGGPLDGILQPAYRDDSGASRIPSRSSERR